MATAIAAGKVYQTRFFCQEVGQVAINVMNWLCITTTGGSAFPIDFANNLKTGMNTLFPPILNNNAYFRGVGCQQSQAPKDAEVYAAAGPTVGTGGATPLPKQCAGLSSLYDGFAGRKHRGRVYWPFASTTLNTVDGIPSTAYMTALAAIKTALTSAIVVTGTGGTATLVLAIFHRLTQTADEVTTWTNRQTWATQRKRGDYGRLNVSPV